MKSIRIANNWIGENHPVFVVAEIGINHGGSVELAAKMIDAAKESGANAVKFQTYITEKRVKKNNPLFPILKKCELSRNNFAKLFNLAKKRKIIFFSTPFDEENADFLEKLGTFAFKIASFYITHLALIRHIARKHLPMIISCGAVEQEEINTIVKLVKHHNTPLALLHCISSYPTKQENANLSVIQTLKRLYNIPIGFSDHTLGIDVAVLSVVAGAKIIEKHFTLNKNLVGPDHKLSIDPKDMELMVQNIRRIEAILGSPEIRLRAAEKSILQFRVYSK